MMAMVVRWWQSSKVKHSFYFPMKEITASSLNNIKPRI